MEAYADFDFYQEEYGGEVIKEEATFSRLVKQASYFINELTLGRIGEPTEEIKMAACEVSEISYREYKQDNEGQIVSEAVGPHSISYSKTTKTTEDYWKQKYAVVRKYLANTGLLYRGISSCNL